MTTPWLKRVNVPVRRFLSCAALAIACSHAHAWERWSAPERGLLLAVNVLSVVDLAQTREIVANPQWHETNPILGRDPTNGEVTAYFLSRAALQYVVADALPSGWRAAYLALELVVSVDTVYGNHKLGINMRF